MQVAVQSKWQRLATVCARWWRYVLDLALMLWVTRVPFAFAALGLLILWQAPQAQDLFVEIVGERGRPTDEFRLIPLFLVLLVFVWAMPTHYAARLLLDTDQRFRAYAGPRPPVPTRPDEVLEEWLPRVLGLTPFVAVIIALARSYVNLPYLDETDVNTAIGFRLLILGALVAVAAALFVYYMLKRPHDANVPWLRWARFIASIAAPLFRLISPGRSGAPEVEQGRDVGRALLILLFVLFVVVLASGADWAAEQFPRALDVRPFAGRRPVDNPARGQSLRASYCCRARRRPGVAHRTRHGRRSMDVREQVHGRRLSAADHHRRCWRGKPRRIFFGERARLPAAGGRVPQDRSERRPQAAVRDLQRLRGLGRRRHGGVGAGDETRQRRSSMPAKEFSTVVGPDHQQLARLLRSAHQRRFPDAGVHRACLPRHGPVRLVARSRRDPGGSLGAPL